MLGIERCLYHRATPRHHLLAGIANHHLGRKIVGLQHQGIEPIGAQVRDQRIALGIGTCRRGVLHANVWHVGYMHQCRGFAQVAAKRHAVAMQQHSAAGIQ
ncbi:hypothetical protein D3C80_1334250 [compost metagenome]